MVEPEHLFSDVDKAAAQAGSSLEEYYTYLRDVKEDPAIRRGIELSLRELNIEKGNTVIDVGCGLGFVVQEIARLVGPTGQVLGVDKSEGMIAAAREEHRRRAGVSYMVGDAMNLAEIADSSVDRYGTWRTLQHVDDPAVALREAARMVKKGGLVGALEPDWTGLEIEGTDLEATRKFVESFRTRIRNPAIGRELPELFQRANLRNVRSFPVGFSTDGDDPSTAVQRASLVIDFNRIREERILKGKQLRDWERSIDSARAAGTFRASLPLYFVVGRK